MAQKPRSKAKKGKAPRKTRSARTPKPRPRQARLGGLEESAIKPLEDAALAYADIRDERMELNTREFDLKGELIRLMKKYDKTVYRRNGITITLTTEQETVKVRVKSKTDDDEETEVSVETSKALPATE